MYYIILYYSLESIICLSFSVSLFNNFFSFSPLGEEGVHTEETELDRNLIELGRFSSFFLLCCLFLLCSVLASPLFHPLHLSRPGHKPGLQCRTREILSSEYCSHCTSRSRESISTVKITSQRCSQCTMR